MDTATWSGPIGLENVRTGDGRLILPDALRWDSLPLPLRWAEADHGEHLGAVVVGRITDIERGEDGKIIGQGEFDLGSQVGREAYRLVEEGWMSGISMDLDDVVLQEGEDPSSFTVSEGRIRAATLVAIPAFEGARIAIKDPVQLAGTTALVAALRAMSDEGSLEISNALFEQALSDGQAVVSGVREDGAVLYDLNPDITFNWVEDVGGLPKYIKRISRHLERKGFTESHAIATAVNVVKKMCATGDLNWPGKQDTNPISRAEACAAVADWTRKKAQARADNLYAESGMETFKDYSPEMRKKLADEGEALPDGSYPIHDCQDLKNAIQSIGRASDPDAAAAHIRKRAKELDCGVELPDSIQAAATTFPAEWFENPNLKAPTALTVTEDGQVYGHVALWASCHIASPQGAGVCTQPPRSKSNYSYFKTGCVSTTRGDQAVGVITLSTVHAGPRLTSLDTMRHYEHTGAVGAYVNAGEDEHGIWVAGAARPDADHTALKAAAISGDWRTIGGNLELVAALSVNVPGFPIPRAEALVAGGQVKSLVASGIVREDTVKLARVEQLRAQLKSAIAFQKVHNTLRSITAAGFKPNQWRVPRGNGDASGQWVDVPNLNELETFLTDNGYTSEQLDGLLGEARPYLEQIDAALENFDGDAAQRAATQAATALAALDSEIPEEAKPALEAVLEAVELVRSSDLSLLGDESIDDPSTDIGAEDEGEKPKAEAKDDGGDRPKAKEEPPAGDDNDTSRVGKLYPTSDRDRSKELENLSVAELHKRATEAKTLDDFKAIANEYDRRLKSKKAE